MSKIFIGSEGVVTAIDSSKGKVCWKVKLENTNKMLSIFQYKTVSVLNHGDHLYAGCNGHVYCLNAETGEVIWHKNLTFLGKNSISMIMHQNNIG